VRDGGSLADGGSKAGRPPLSPAPETRRGGGHPPSAAPSPVASAMAASDGRWREVGLQGEGASVTSWGRGARAAEEFPGGDEVQAAELPFTTATLGKGARSLGGRIGTRGGPSRNLLDPPRNEGDGGRRFFGVLLQDDRCRPKNGIRFLEETDPVPVRMVLSVCPLEAAISYSRWVPWDTYRR
jgi:hypothetical protein